MILKKRQKENRENNSKRVELLRDSFLAFVDWEKMDSEIEALENVSKEQIIRVAQKYYGDNYVVWVQDRRTTRITSIEKPEIDPLSIDPDKESDFKEK